MLKHPTTHLRLSQRVRKLARLSAAAIDASLSDYIASLIVRDAKRTGIDQLITKYASEVTR